MATAAPTLHQDDSRRRQRSSLGVHQDDGDDDDEEHRGRDSAGDGDDEDDEYVAADGTPGHQGEREDGEDGNGEAEEAEEQPGDVREASAVAPADLKLAELRSELKKRGLSPSGLKHVLVRRLEEALSAAGEHSVIIAPPSGDTAVGATSKPAGGGAPRHARDGGAGGGPRNEATALGGRAESYDGVDSDRYDGEDEYPVDEKREGNDDDHAACAAALAKKRRRKKSLFSSSSSSRKRRRHAGGQKKKQKGHTHNGSPLSGHSFVKEARYSLQLPQTPFTEEIRSLEEFRFAGSNFQFTYQFWRGQTLLHSFEIEAGTFLIVDDAVPLPSDHRQCRVVLRWPSPIYYPLLQTWRFHQTYSHFFLHGSPSTSNTIPAALSPVATAPSSSLGTPSSRPTSPSGVVPSSESSPCLISPLGSIFVQQA